MAETNSTGAPGEPWAASSVGCWSEVGGAWKEHLDTYIAQQTATARAEGRAEGLREAVGVVRDYATKNTLNLCGADNHLESLASSPGGGELERLREAALKP